MDSKFEILGRIVFAFLVIYLIAGTSWNLYYAHQKLTPAVIKVANVMRETNKANASFQQYAKESIEYYQSKIKPKQK